MQEITQEQAARLESFAEQRDVLQNEVSSLTKERDSLLAVNKELTGSNSQLEIEIGERHAILASFTNSIIDEINGVSRELVQVNKEIAKAESKRDTVLAEIETAKTQLKNIVEIVNTIQNSVKETQDNLRGVNSQVNVYLTAIKEAADDVVAQTTNVKNAAQIFADNISKEHKHVASLKSEVDKKEIMLRDRETAINELVSDYKETLKNRK